MTLNELIDKIEKIQNNKENIDWYVLQLADKLVESNSVSWGSCTHEQHDNDKYFKEQAATMLRQQQAEIEALKKEAALQRLSDFTQEVEAKYSDAWWKEVDEFNKQLKAQEK